MHHSARNHPARSPTIARSILKGLFAETFIGERCPWSAWNDGPEGPGDCVLNEGGHQIPIYYGAPTKKKTFNVDIKQYAN